VWLGLCGLGVWLCEQAGRALGDPDHPAIVWDEICGQAIVLLLVPHSYGGIAAGFLAFRFFDIVKPWPIHVVDRRLSNGFGCMADDVMAAVYAAATLGAANWLMMRM
jgi:phosphatidylglycerophosphatase A